MHIHIGILDALKTFAYVIIVGFFWRYLSMRWYNTPGGQAMAFVY